MQRQHRPESYSPLQRGLHWLIALIVLCLIPVGLFMTWRAGASGLLSPVLGPSPKLFDAFTSTLYTWHKSFGFLVLLLMVWRIVVRLRRGVPAPEPTLNAFQRIASEATHHAIYLLLIVVPILGWVGVSAYGAPEIIGGLRLPAVVAEDKRLAGTILSLHGWAALALAALIGMHIGAALFHRLILKDGVLDRMLPRRRRD